MYNTVVGSVLLPLLEPFRPLFGATVGKHKGSATLETVCGACMAAQIPEVKNSNKRAMGPSTFTSNST